MDGIRVKEPKGYYTNADYFGYLPDGSRQRYVSEKEYEEDFKEILADKMAEIRSRQNPSLLQERVTELGESTGVTSVVQTWKDTLYQMVDEMVVQIHPDARCLKGHTWVAILAERGR